VVAVFLAACGTFTASEPTVAPQPDAASPVEAAAPTDASVDASSEEAPDVGEPQTRRARDIGAGNEHTCLVRDDGALFCWGRNDVGQLGLGTNTDVFVPTRVALPGPASAVALGVSHTCVLMADGAVFCWGVAGSGQLGTGVLQATNKPPVVGLGLGEPAVEVVTGGQHTCARLASGTVKCWGYNSEGQIDLGLPLAVALPTVVPLGPGVEQLALGRDFSCARYTKGNVRCWGSNEFGQLGAPTADGGLRSGPVDVTMPLGSMANITAVQLAAGFYTVCAVLSDRGLACWGYGAYGSIGDGATNARRTPVRAQIVDVERVAVGNRHTCAVRAGGEVQCWGTGERGQLGDGVGVLRPVPMATNLAPQPVEQLVAGGASTCVRTKSGQVHCWGDNGRGQLGIGGASAISSPRLLQGIGPASGIALGRKHTCLRDSAGLRCWGANERGALGLGDELHRGAPGAIASVSTSTVVIGTNENTTCAMAGSLQCWGDNEFGQLGIGSNDLKRLVPTDVSGALVATKLAQGEGHTCALLQGKVRCWGLNSYGSVGTGSMASKVTTPSGDLVFPADVTDIAAGRFHTCAVHGMGISCWGFNSFGQLGNSDPKDKTTPALVAHALSGSFTKVSAGYDTTCGLLSNGNLACWGLNNYGQLGIGSTGNKSTPTLVNFPSNAAIRQVAVGGAHTCALSQSQTVFCWGSNERGQVGVGSDKSQPQPVAIPEEVISITSGLNASCATTAAGKVYCWGDNGRGQLGFATPDTDALVPGALPIPQN